jgi:hypothetical protein
MVRMICISRVKPIRANSGFLNRHAAIYTPAWAIRAKSRDSVASQPAICAGRV